jgi:hypothetical protein
MQNIRKHNICKRFTINWTYYTDALNIHYTTYNYVHHVVSKLPLPSPRSPHITLSTPTALRRRLFTRHVAVRRAPEMEVHVMLRPAGILVAKTYGQQNNIKSLKTLPILFKTPHPPSSCQRSQSECWSKQRGVMKISVLSSCMREVYQNTEL